MSNAQHLAVREALAGRNIFLTGGSGFVGKVWLSMVLTHLPEVGRIYVFLRPKASVPAKQRFEKMLNTSPVFRPLHERYGRDLSAFLSERVELVEGELTAPDLGLAPAVARRLRRDIDVFVHCAGLVDFNPDLRKSLSANVDATMRVADFVESCDHASLLHVSTCYVAGKRYGEIEEKTENNYAPEAEGFCARAELAEAHARIESIVRSFETEDVKQRVREEVLAELHAQGRQEPSPHLLDTLTRKRQREELKQALETEGTERAVRLGWHNTYTYSKSLAESLLAQRSSRLRYAVLRPSIVESAVEFPEPGWNESFNCTAPLAYIMGSWFRMVPARPDAPFDVIPVDLVCRALITVSAALAAGRHAPVYHVGTSDKHRCSVGRAAELIVLSHRRYLREGRHTRRERVLKSRWDAILVEPDSVLGIKTSRALVRGYDEVVDLLPRKLQKKLGKLSERVRDMDEDFAQVEKLCELFMPFMYESYYVFKSHAFDRHPVLEPEFDWGPARFDWRKYWLDIEMPGLRRWAFPLIEGKRPERYRAPHAIRLRERLEERPTRDDRSSHDEAKAHEPMLFSSTNDQA
ncbi:MAG TPA: SDR family oxidoreductase [Polyangiales bacterium]|nr:SDR family oxidoreductase [Polyangiales bacterium]